MHCKETILQAWLWSAGRAWIRDSLGAYLLCRILTTWVKFLLSFSSAPVGNMRFSNYRALAVRCTEAETKAHRVERSKVARPGTSVAHCWWRERFAADSS